MPASMIIAPVGSSLKVSGSSIAIVAGGPRPGSTPMIVPSTTPITHIVRLLAVSATWNPCRSPSRMSMRLEQQSVRKRQVEGELEERIETERESDRDREGDPLRAPRHHLHDEPGGQREGNRETPERHERHAGDERHPAAERAAEIVPHHRFARRRTLDDRGDDERED